MAEKGRSGGGRWRVWGWQYLWSQAGCRWRTRSFSCAVPQQHFSWLTFRREKGGDLVCVLPANTKGPVIVVAFVDESTYHFKAGVRPGN